MGQKIDDIIEDVVVRNPLQWWNFLLTLAFCAGAVVWSYMS